MLASVPPWGAMAVSAVEAPKHDLGPKPRLSVSAPPGPGGTMPIRIESSSSHVAEGQTLDLNCVVAGQPQATITWYKRGGSLPARHQVWSGARPWGGQLEDRR